MANISPPLLIVAPHIPHDISALSLLRALFEQLMQAPQSGMLVLPLADRDRDIERAQTEGKEAQRGINLRALTFSTLMYLREMR